MGSGGPTGGQNVPGQWMINPAYAQQQMQPQAAPPQAAPPGRRAEKDNLWQNTIAMLANPGKVTTHGATVPASASAQPGSANLQSRSWPIGSRRRAGLALASQQNFATALKEGWDIEAMAGILIF